MKRTIINVPMNTISVEEVIRIYDQTLVPEGYCPNIMNGEKVWSKGDGSMIKVQAFTLAFSDHAVLLQAWLHDNMTGDSDLNGGWVAALPKKKMLNLLETVRNRILQADQMAANQTRQAEITQQNSGEVKCPACGKMNGAKNTFCIGCGQRLHKEKPSAAVAAPEKPAPSSAAEGVCPCCGKEAKPTDVFCTQCGWKFEPGAVKIPSRKPADVPKSPKKKSVPAPEKTIDSAKAFQEQRAENEVVETEIKFGEGWETAGKQMDLQEEIRPEWKKAGDLTEENI